MTIVEEAIFNTTISRVGDLIKQTGLPQVYWRVWKVANEGGEYRGELSGWMYGKGQLTTEEKGLSEVIEEILTQVRVWDLEIGLGLE